MARRYTRKSSRRTTRRRRSTRRSWMPRFTRRGALAGLVGGSLALLGAGSRSAAGRRLLARIAGYLPAARSRASTMS